MTSPPRSDGAPAVPVARPYRWFGRDAPRGGWPAPHCPPGGPTGALPAVWRWAAAADRADPTARTAVWTRSALSAVRAGLRSAGIDLPPGPTIAAVADDWARRAETPPGHGVPRTVLGTLGDSGGDAAAVIEALTALRSWPPLPVPELAADARPGTGVGRVGDAVVVRIGSGGGWAVPETPIGWYGAPGPPLRGGAVEAPAAWADAVGGDLERALGCLPRQPAVWRRDALLLLLARLTPLDLCGGVTPDERGLGLLADAVAGTRLEGPILATAGEWLLAEGRVAPVPPRGTAAARCVRALVVARGLDGPEAVELFVAVRDPATGLVDVGGEAFRRGALAPLADALAAEDPRGFARAVLRIDALGGTETVAAALDRLLADGVTTPAGLGRIGARLGEDRGRTAAIVAGTVHAGWLGVE